MQHNGVIYITILWTYLLQLFLSHRYVYNMGHKCNTFVMYIPTLWKYLLHNTYVTKLYIYQIPVMKKSYVYTNMVKVMYIKTNTLSLAHLSQKKLFCTDSSPHYFLCTYRLTTLHKIKKGQKIHWNASKMKT